MIENEFPVTLETLVGEIAKARYEGYRWVTMTCVELDAETVAVIYHFDRDYQLKHFRLTVFKETAIPSISHIFTAAFLVENEIQDLFHLIFSGLTLDFHRTLYFDGESRTAPFCRYCVDEEKD